MRFNMRTINTCLAGLAFAILALPVHAQEMTENEAFFESKVRPVLASNCYSCHTGAKSGGLRLDSRDAIVKGGDTGPAIVPGKADDSLLIQAVKQTHAKISMPPGDKLEDLDITNLTKWVNSGAAWPAGDTPVMTVETGYQITSAQRAFWSYQPIKNPAVPTARLKNWQLNAIDAFILAKLDEKKLTPVAKASKLQLIRRATFDLTGLPPTPKEIDAYLADKTPQAFEKVIDRLLASKSYGERWGRHWLDVVRYADTAGDASDYPIPQTIQYRDYVIKAFNDDKPYNQFVREQIAGDLLPYANDEERWEKLNATGYIAGARRFNVNPLQYMHMTIDDTIDNYGKTFLGLSIACARCHDHKFDPIPNKDYYAIYGIFQSSKYPFPGSEKNHKPQDLTPRDPKEYTTVLKPYLDELYKITGRLGKVEGEKRAWVPGGKRTYEEIMDEIHSLEKQRAPMIEKMPQVQMSYAMAEGNIGNARIHKRGDHRQLGDEVPRGFLQILGKSNPKIEGSGRLQLADWTVDPENPLPARVMANRIWQYHFGKGLVTSPSDYGKRGTQPTHPELLDYLATQFVKGGWSVKKMHKMIMLSETYQLASAENAENAKIDVSNEFLWRFDRLRLDAEETRDSLLSIGGTLQPGTGGNHPFPNMGTWVFMQHDPFNAVYPSNHRSVYLMNQRIQRHPFLSMFDGADAAIGTATRPLTITPIQALHFMNSDMVHTAAEGLAKQVMKAQPSQRIQVNSAYRIALGRPATAAEIARAATYITKARQTLKASGTSAADLPVKSLASYLRVVLASNEFSFID